MRPRPDRSRGPRIPFWAIAGCSVLTLLVPARQLPDPAAADSLPLALVVNVSLAVVALTLGGVSISGAAAGLLVGVLLIVGLGWGAWILLAGCFVIATAATRAGAARKAAAGIAESGRGRRRAGNVVANTGVGALAAAFALLGDHQGTAAIAAAAALTTGASDTMASEIGKAYGGRTRHLWTGATVPAGTTGAVSLAGTAAGLGAVVFLSTLAYAGGLSATPTAAAVVGAAAMMASLGEGWVALLLENTGWIDNNGVNFLSSAVAAALAIAGYRLIQP